MKSPKTPTKRAPVVIETEGPETNGAPSLPDVVTTAVVTTKALRPSRSNDVTASNRVRSNTLDGSGMHVSPQINKLRVKRGGGGGGGGERTTIQGKQIKITLTDGSRTVTTHKGTESNGLGEDQVKDAIVTQNAIHHKGKPSRSSSRSKNELQPFLLSTTPAKLTAIESNGRLSTVSLILANCPYVVDDVHSPESPSILLSTGSKRGVPSTTATITGSTNVLGNDGNQYYCNVCTEYGDVVCCDGCPRVFHRECVPEDDPSRKSLDIDDDPWYCPQCFLSHRATNKKGKSNGGTKKKQNTTIAITINTKTKKDDNASSSRPVSRKSDRSNKGIISTASKDRKNVSEFLEAKRGKAVASPSSQIQRNSDDTTTDETTEHNNNNNNNKASNQPLTSSTSLGVVDNEEVDDIRRIRKRKNSFSASSIGDDENEYNSERKIPKSKKRRDSISEVPILEAEDCEIKSASNETEESVLPAAAMITNNIPKAIPAFFFYLGENRSKIERALARKHRTFNRLAKGEERNEIVAREAATWWVKLLPSDHTQYMNKSMLDFEARIKEWKLLKNQILEAGYYEEPTDGGGESHLVPEAFGHDLQQPDDDQLAADKHQRLYNSISVGSKPFKLEAGQSYNRVLLDLLQDVRFHPLPMMQANRPETNSSSEAVHSRFALPYFEVQGPVATGIGDECLGCSRGWLHYCSVLQTRIPAVEIRANLQPQVSSLLATRIGLGLRPRPVERGGYITSSVDEEKYYSVEQKPFTWKDSIESREIKCLPIVPCCSVPNPSKRLDDVVHFIEEAVAMKVPEPAIGSLYDDTDVLIESNLLTSFRTKDTTTGSLDSENGLLKKCGQCRTIVDNETGCYQCRRAQLVLNKSKLPASVSVSSPGKPKPDTKMVRVRTTMLGRVLLAKEGLAEEQSDRDRRISEMIRTQRWTPNIVLPPRRVVVPNQLKRLCSKRSWSSRVEDFVKDDDDDSGDSTHEGNLMKGTPQNQSTEMPLEYNSVKSIEVTDDPTTSDELPTKRLRLSRLAATSPSAPHGEMDRQEVMTKYRKEVNEISTKTVQIACYGILLALTRRDPLHLFATPVTVEGYTFIIRNPMDFGKIRESVLSGKYGSLGSFVTDAKLLCENALRYNFNHPTSIYYRTAKELLDNLSILQKRAANWIGCIKDAFTSYHLHKRQTPKRSTDSEILDGEYLYNNGEDDPFEDLRRKWPQGVLMFERGDLWRKMIEADFMRTQENECAYYGNLAVSRAATAAAASLAPYPVSTGMYNVVCMRKHYEDECLRDHIDEQVSKLVGLTHLRKVPNWREESIVCLMRKVQSMRLERRTQSKNGCSRCDGAIIDNDAKVAFNVEAAIPGKVKKKSDCDVQRVDGSRTYLTTGLGSAKTCQKIEQRREAGPIAAYDTVREACVSVRGSKIHGMGLFADQPFRKGDVVAEYIGEYIGNPVCELREKIYRDQRIQDYQFRLHEKLIIDATMKGGHGRYINHCCTPNCFAKIIPYKSQKNDVTTVQTNAFELKNPTDGSNGNGVAVAGDTEVVPNSNDDQYKRVMIVAQKNIDINEEITYDYQFPLELDLDSRVACHCQSETCRGFMNWDLPEKVSTNKRTLPVQRKSGNIRDRIRRLEKPPLKRDEVFEV